MLDMAIIRSMNGSVSVEGSTGATVLWALADYLKVECGCHLEWNFRQFKKHLSKILFSF